MGTQSITLEWIAAVCRQLSRVTGWPTVFAPASDPLQGTLAGVRPRPDYVWRCEVGGANDSLGSVEVTLPPGRELDDSFLRACEFADLTVQLVQRILVQQPLAAEPPGPTPAAGGATQDRRVTAPDAWTLSVDRVLGVMLKVTGLRAAALCVLDEQESRLRLRAERTHDGRSALTCGRPLTDVPVDLETLRHRSLVIRRREGRFMEWLPAEMSLGICRAISTSQGIGGALWMYDRRDRRLTPREEHVIDSVVIRLAELVEQGVVVEERALQRQLRAELRIAAESQPQQQILLEGSRGWCRIAGRAESAREVGGDLCEAIPLGNQRMLIAVGDAAGHSIPAAMVMAAVRGALRVMLCGSASPIAEPDQIALRLNRMLHGIVESHQFMTLACAVIDGREQTLTLANAGHPPALLIRRGEVHRLECTGLVLGVVGDAEYHSRTFRLEPDDLLIFYTDGVSEAPGEQGVLFGAGGIWSVILQFADASPEVILEHVWDALKEHLAMDRTDDRTLLIVQFTGFPSATARAIRSAALAVQHR